MGLHANLIGKVNMKINNIQFKCLGSMQFFVCLTKLIRLFTKDSLNG